MNNNQRINQLLMQTRGLSSTNLEGTALIERLRKEAFALAAWSCREIDRITEERDEAIIGANAVIREASALITAKIPSGKASAYWNAVDQFRRTETKTT
jgi:hypothetical protein